MESDPSARSNKSWLKFILLGIVLVGAYFLNVEIQTRLGEKALAAVPIEKHSLDQAFNKARAENKLVIADLSAIWCPTCRSLDKNLFSNPIVKEAIDQNYVFARIEYESPEGEAFQQIYNVRSFPTLLILAPSGTKIKELPVTTDPDEFIAEI